jgi:hypothetical protein
LKRILLTLLVLAAGAGRLAALETAWNKAAGGEAAGKTAGWGHSSWRPDGWREWLRGLSLGIEAGSREFPLKLWYPAGNSDGYSIRSLYLMPNAAYRQRINDFTVFAELEVTTDIGAPDPGPEASALDAKSADRKNWYTIYMEEEVDYRFSSFFAERINFPGSISAFVNMRNHIYAFPDFPAVSGIRPVEGKKADGRLEPGFDYFQDFNFGRIHGRLGLPVSWLNRYNDDLGFGMTVTAGYRDGFGIGLSGEITSTTAFLPDVTQSETGFTVMYTWGDFSAELEITALGPFESAVINPEVQYRYRRIVFKIGLEISEPGRATAFSPYMGLNWIF